MKVLMVNKFFYIKGGSETYYFALKKLLQEKGHEVIDFSMEDALNFPSPYTDYFVENVEYNGRTSLVDKIKLSSRILYSFEAKKKLEALIRKTKPDIAHLHIFQHQMSPSILAVLQKYKIPVVYTAHDLKMLCLNYKMLNATGICEKCKDHKYYNCVKYKCIKESRAKSIICMLEGYLHQILKSYDKIDCILTPSSFYYHKFLDFGIARERLFYLPNFLEETGEKEIRTGETGQYFLYLGRISEEKGILTLIEAVRDTKEQLQIAGTGPLEEEINRYLAAHNIKNVTMLGYRKQPELGEIVQRAKAVILPSEWYENSPYSGIEAISIGKILIGAAIGGIPELIEEGKNGYLFPSGDVKALRKCITEVSLLPEPELKKMREYSRELFEKRFTAAIHYEKLMEQYERCMAKEKMKDESNKI